MIWRFLLSLILTPRARVNKGVEWLFEHGYMLCPCVVEDRYDRWCWRCFGFRAIPSGGYEIRILEELTYDEKVRAGDKLRGECGFSTCDCMTQHGPNRLCPRCGGTGALPPDEYVSK